MKFQKNPVILLAFGYILRKKGCNFCLESNYQKVHLLIIMSEIPLEMISVIAIIVVFKITFSNDKIEIMVAAV